jgi:Glycosyl hydrolases family 16
MVQAANPQHFLKYGFAAARVKFSPQRGQHSAFWLDVPDYAAITPGNPSTGTEIDVAEYFGDDRPKGGLASYVHWMNKKKGWDSLGGEYKSRDLLPNKKKEWSQGWHVFSVEWSPSGYIFRVDGTVTLKTAKAVSNSPQKVVLSSLTSMWELPNLKVNKLPSLTKYDWVRIYQRPGA